jgi:glutathione S-transferase
VAEPATLVVIPVSHYCEKARWGLDRIGFAYREEPHFPGASTLAAARRRGGLTVPVLLHEGRVIGGSGRIIRYADRDGALRPSDPAAAARADRFEARCDAELGPGARRWAYSWLLPRKDLGDAVLGQRLPAGERRAMRLAAPAMRAAIRVRVGLVGSGKAEEALALTQGVFDAAAELLADGRPYLTGDTLSTADIAFAALAAPVLGPAEYGAWLPPVREFPPTAAAVIAGFREHPAGAWALALYARHRHTSPGAATNTNL